MILHFFTYIYILLFKAYLVCQIHIFHYLKFNCQLPTLLQLVLETKESRQELIPLGVVESRKLSHADACVQAHIRA